ARPKPDGKILAKRLFGLEVESLTNPDRRLYSNRAKPGNVGIKSVESGSPADQAEIKPGDLLISVDGTSINKLEDLGLQLEMISSGSTVELILIRSQRTTWGQTLFQHTLPLRAR
ncbi:MAG: PDZ domain-containing protein, partial [Planctomycetes bacterium]|nr:PDZ domain-containing protein [Planctomycetota bacterium]